MAGFTLPQVNLQPGFNALAQGLQMGQEKRSQNALAAALPGALNNDPTALQKLFKASPEWALKVQAYNNQRADAADTLKRAEAEKQRGQMQNDMVGAFASIWQMPPEQRPAAFAQAQSALHQKYGIGDDEQYDEPTFKAHALQLAASSKEAADIFGRVGLLPPEPGKPQGMQSVSPGGAIVDPNTGKVIFQAPFKPDAPQADTSNWRDFQASQRNPEYAKFLAAKSGGGGLTVDPETGAVTAGGFKAKPIPAEIGTRMALGTSWASQVPDILASIAEGTTSGLNRAGMATGMGKGAAVARRQASGVDALVRSLTGAGMNLQEARKYASRYEIGADDGTDTQRNKVLQLAQELRTIDDSVSKQYGQPASGAYDNIPKPPNLSDELGKQPAIPNGWSVQEH